MANVYPELGDITFFVGFLLSGAAYLVLCRSKIAAERVAV
jgi:cytosine/uracil/thiamine/allantoin permease